MINKADLDQLQNAGYVILKNRIGLQLVMDARNSINDRIRAVTNTSTETLFRPPIERYGDWPPECKKLSNEIMKAIAYSTFRPGSPSTEPTFALGVYQPKTGRYRAAAEGEDVLFYTVSLDEIINQGNGLPKFIKGSHKTEHTTLVELSGEELELHKGDVLVWDGQTKFVCSGTGGAAFMSIKWTSK